MKLNSGFELRHALIERAHTYAQARRFEQAGESGGAEQRPILAELGEPGQVANLVVEPHVSEAERELGTRATADVAVADVSVVAFKIGLHLAGDGEVRALGHPFTLRANAELASLDVNLGVRGGTGIAEQKRERPVLDRKST